MNAVADPAQRLDRAFTAWRSAPDDLATQTRLAITLYHNADQATAAHLDAIGSMVRDPAIDPAQFECSGWVALGDTLPAPEHPEAAASWLEKHATALGLLEETQVAEAKAERLLSAIRRWLLIHGRVA